MSREQHEAAVVLAFFEHAPEGEAVVDGDGIIWEHQNGLWWDGRSRFVESAVLARALNPDLAEHMVVI